MNLGDGPQGTLGRLGRQVGGGLWAEGRAVGTRADGYCQTPRMGGRGIRGDVVARAARSATGRSISTSLTGEPVGRWRELGRRCPASWPLWSGCWEGRPWSATFKERCSGPRWCWRADLTGGRGPAGAGSVVPEASEAVGPVSPQAVGDCRLIGTCLAHVANPRCKGRPSLGLSGEAGEGGAKTTAPAQPGSHCP